MRSFVYDFQCTITAKFLGFESKLHSDFVTCHQFLFKSPTQCLIYTKFFCLHFIPGVSLYGEAKT